MNSVEDFPEDDSEKEFETDNYINESMSIILDYINDLRCLLKKSLIG